MATYTLTSIARSELHDILGLTGAEISCNVLPAGASVPFVHEVQAQRGNLPHSRRRGKAVCRRRRNDTEGRRLLFALSPKANAASAPPQTAPTRFICVQARVGSLDTFTMSDGIVSDKKPSWL